MEPTNDVALDIIITNVVSVFRTRCHLNLRTIGLEGNNVIYKPEVGVGDLKCLGDVWSRNSLLTKTCLCLYGFLLESLNEAA